MPGTRGSLLAAGAEGADEDLREALILATLFAHPVLITDFDGPLVDLEPRREDHRRLQAVLLAAAHEDPAPSRAVLAERAGEALATLHALPHVAIAPMLRPEVAPDFVRNCLTEDFQVLLSRRALKRELNELAAEIEDIPDDTLTWRLGQTAAALDRAGRGASNESTTDLGEDRAELAAQLQSLIDAQVWVKRSEDPGRRESTAPESVNLATPPVIRPAQGLSL